MRRHLSPRKNSNAAPGRRTPRVRRHCSTDVGQDVRPGVSGVFMHRKMQTESSAYRPCVGIMVLNRAGLVWIGRRPDAPAEPEGPGAWWQMPQGGIDESEDPEKAALLEPAEVAGTRSVAIVAD